MPNAKTTFMIRTFTIILLILTSCFSFSQTTCDSLILLKKKTYGFRPAALSDSLKDLKSGDLDIFWNTAKNNPIDAAKCLQTLIVEETKDSYFCFDASSLLLRLDTTDKYFPTIIAGLKKCNLEDLQLSSYLQICFYLGYKGQDIGELTIKLISIPNAKIFLSNHFLTLNAIDASLFLFNIMPPTIAENTLISAIQNGNPTAKHNAAVVLNILATDNGDNFLNSSIENKQLGDSTIQFINKDRKTFIIEPQGSASRSKVLEALDDVPYNFKKEFYGFAGNDKLIGSACKQLNKQDIDKIRNARRKSTPGLSDEALHEYFALTTILMTVRGKKEK
jgi:hypothetical protein